MADTEKTFAKGIYFELPREGAPDYVRGRVSFKVAEAIAFLKEHENNAGFVNCELKVSQGGKAYVELNTWKPEKPASVAETSDVIDYPSEDINPDDIPF